MKFTLALATLASVAMAAGNASNETSISTGLANVNLISTGVIAGVAAGVAALLI
jgi:hypothetical protein